MISDANDVQDIAPNYYDLDTFKNNEIKKALQRVINTQMRKSTMKKR
jgi:hypothetical protein